MGSQYSFGFTVSGAAVVDAHGIHAFLDPSKRLLVQRSLRCRHRPAEIDNPVTSGAAGQVHAVDPRFQDVSVGPAVWISR